VEGDVLVIHGDQVQILAGAEASEAGALVTRGSELLKETPEKQPDAVNKNTSKISDQL